jgi:uncharacterized protein (DUF1501 family)
VGTTGLLSALAQLRVIGAAAADSVALNHRAGAATDYKALVCVFLNGGNDGNSVLVPRAGSDYTAYANARGLLAIGQSDLLPIQPRAYQDGRAYGLHPSLPELRSLFEQGKAAILANVGTLGAPTTLAQYRSGSGLPKRLFSHTDQALQWQSSLVEGTFETGWGGRLADAVDAMNSSHQISMSITLNGANWFQIGRQVLPYTVSPNGAFGFHGGAGSPYYPVIRDTMGDANPNLLAGALGAVSKSALDDSVVLNETLRAAPVLSTRFPSSTTAARLAMIARLIAVAERLGLKRQLFFLQIHGWDLHGGQVAGHGPLLAELSSALGAFYEATVELGVSEQVTTFTASDFNRTYAPNGQGTDHGWGNLQFVVGGAVKGGDIYGRMPSLALNGPDDVGRGRWIPSTSVDEYNATLATWFGVSASNLPTVLPNIGRFARRDLGFMR